MEGQITVDNSVPSQSPAPAAPEPTAVPTPAPALEPAPQSAQPGERSIETLHALLDGADPATLFGGQSGQPPAAAPAPRPTEPTPAPAAAAPAEPRIIDQIPDKFKNPDGTLNAEALMKSYVGMEKILGDQGNKLGILERQLREVTAQPPQPQPAQTAQPEALPVEEPKFPWEMEMTPEEKEQFLEEFYADPLAAMTKRDQQILKAMEYRLQQILQPLAPVVESHQYNQQINSYVGQIQEFAKTNPDIFDYQPEIEQVINRYGDAVTSLPNAVEVIYNMAKGMRPAPAAPPPPPTVDDMLKDPIIRQKILADPSFQAEARKGYVQEVKAGAPPVVIGAQPGGAPVAVPSEKPRSVREASSFFGRFLRQQQ